MEKTTEALQFELPIDLTAGKVDTDKMVKPIKAALDEVGRKLSAEKIDIPGVGLDEAQIRQALTRLPAIVKDASAKAMKTLGAGLPSKDIASEFAKRLKASEGVVNAQGKVLVRRAREILKEVAAETGHPLKGLTYGKGGNPLSELLAIQGKSLDDAVKTIKGKAPKYRELIKGFSQIPSQFKKGQFAELSNELAAYSKQLKTAQEYQEYLHKTQLRTAEMTGIASIKAGEAAAQVTARDLGFRKGVRLAEAKRKGDEIIAAHDKAEKEKAAEEIKNLNYRKSIRLSEAKKRGAESTALADRFEKLQDSSTKLRAGFEHATPAEYLKDINAQARLVREALKDFSPKYNKREYEWLEAELKELRKLAEESGKVIEETKGKGVINAKTKVERAKARLEDTQFHIDELPSNASARERLQLLTAQRNATEALIASIRDLKREELKVYNDLVKKRAESVAAFGGAGKTEMPVRPDFTVYDAEIAKHNKAISGLNEQLSGLDNLWNKVSQSMGLFLRYAVIYRIFYEISNSVTALVQSVVALQGALVNIKAVTNATISQMTEVGAAIRDVAKSTAFSTEDVAKGGQTLVQAGIPLKDFATSLKATADLASSTASGFQETADVISTYKQVYKEMDVQTIADKIRNAVNISKLDMQGVATMANYVLETSEAYKISLDAMQGALTTLKNAGIKDSTAGTGLRQGILELLSPDAKTLKALQARYAKLGINMSQETIKAMFAGFRDAKNPILAVVNELQKLGMGGAGENDLARVFDVRAENVIKTLVQNKEAMIANEVAMRQTGTAAEGAKTQLEGLKNSFQNLGETIVSIASSASEGFIEDIVGMLHKATAMLDEFSAKVTQRKAETGDTGLQSALTTGLSTTVLSLAGKASVGVSALRGVLATAAIEIVKIFAPADAAIQKLAKAAEAAANALLLMMAAKGLPGIFEKLGRTFLGDKAIDAMTGGGIGAAAGKVAQSVKKVAADNSMLKVEAAMTAVSAGLAVAKTWGAKLLTFGKWMVTGPGGWISSALLFAADYFDLWDKAFGASDKEKLAEIAKAKQAALEEQTAELKTKQKELDDLERENKQRQENQRLLKNSADDLQGILDKYTNNSPVEITNEVNADQVTKLLSEASKGAVALGTTALENVAKQVADKMGKAAGDVSAYDLSSDLQKMDTVFQQVESARKTYIESVIKAQEDLAKDSGDLKARGIVEPFEKLANDQKAILLNAVSTAQDVKGVVDALGKVIEAQGVSKANLSSDTLFKKNLQVNSLLEQLVGEGGAIQAGPSGQLKSMLLDAVQKGEVALVEYIINATNEHLGKAVAGGLKQASFLPTSLLQIAKENQINTLMAPFLEARKKNEELVTKAETKVSPEQFNAEFLKQQAKVQSGNAEAESVRSALEASLLSKRKELSDFVKSVESGSKSVESLEAARKKLDDLNNEIAGIQDKISASKKGELEGAQALEAAQRGFIVGEEQIKALQDKLKTVHSARLHSVEEEVDLLKQIFDVQSKQLEAEKLVLAATLAKAAEKETNLATKGLSPEELLEALSGPAGKAALEGSKELADAYKALSEVVNKQRDLQDKYNTDVDNVRRKDLETKEKAAKTAYDKAAGRTTSLESKLQTTTDRLINAREKLREAYEKQAELEDFFTNQLREISGEKKTARDVKATLARARETGSTELAKQAATEAKGLMDSGEIGQREAEGLTKQARQIAYDSQKAVIDRETLNVQNLQTSQATLAAAVSASRDSQERLKASLDSLTDAIKALNGEAAANGTDLSKTDKYGDLPAVPAASGGSFWGDNPSMWSDAHNMLQRARSTRVDSSFARNVNTPVLSGLGPTTASRPVEKQPIIFQVGDNTIRADAQVDAVNQFKTALQLAALKQGRKS